MAKYIAIRVQNGEGCDYTIGCGINYVEVEADSFEEAFEKLKVQCYLDDYEDECYLEGLENLRHGEMSLKSFTIYEVAAERDDIYETWLDNLIAKAEGAEQASETEARRKQYEELQKEFGN